MGIKAIVLVCIVSSLIIEKSFQLTTQDVMDAVDQGIVFDFNTKEANRLIKDLGVDQQEKTSNRNLRVATGGTVHRKAFVESGRIVAEATRKLSIDNVDLPDSICPYSVPKCEDPPSKYRTADGSCNNLKNPNWGRAETPQLRFVKPAYDDGVSKPRTRSGGRLLPSARLVSRIVHTPDSDSTFAKEYTHMAMQWGQFLDHDITLTPTEAEEQGTTITCCAEDLEETLQGQITQAELDRRPECFPISIPPRDGHFTDSCMNFIRSVRVPNLQCRTGPVEQLNSITAYIDASNVYGSTEEEQKHLRELSGGRLKSAPHDLLPEDSVQSCSNISPGEYCFVAGDVRVNEQPGLASMHTIFLREHNRIAGRLAKINSHWGDSKLFDETRRIVGAVMQHVTFNEYLPHVIGKHLMDEMGLQPTAQGHATVYDDTRDASIRNEFSTAAYRFGHSLIRESFSRSFGGTNADTVLSDMFFRPIYVSEDSGEGLNRVLNGLRKDNCQKSDRLFTTELTNRLFEEAPGRSFDLVALNIQRGRDHGIPSYNAIRSFCGLEKAGSFTSDKGGFINHTPEIVDRLRKVYLHPDDVDLFSGGISETNVEGGLVGPTFACIISRQFSNFKFGDRFWYENNYKPTRFTLAQLNALKKVTIAKIICQNSGLKRIQKDIFKVIEAPGNEEVDCNELESLDLNAWKE